MNILNLFTEVIVETGVVIEVGVKNFCCCCCCAARVALLFVTILVMTFAGSWICCWPAVSCELGDVIMVGLVMTSTLVFFAATTCKSKIKMNEGIAGGGILYSDPRSLKVWFWCTWDWNCGAPAVMVGDVIWTELFGDRALRLIFAGKLFTAERGNAFNPLIWIGIAPFNLIMMHENVYNLY